MDNTKLQIKDDIESVSERVKNVSLNSVSTDDLKRIFILSSKGDYEGVEYILNRRLSFMDKNNSTTDIYHIEQECYKILKTNGVDDNTCNICISRICLYDLFSTFIYNRQYNKNDAVRLISKVINQGKVEATSNVILTDLINLINRCIFFILNMLKKIVASIIGSTIAAIATLAFTTVIGWAFWGSSAVWSFISGHPFLNSVVETFKSLFDNFIKTPAKVLVNAQSNTDRMTKENPPVDYNSMGIDPAGDDSGFDSEKYQSYQSKLQSRGIAPSQNVTSPQTDPFSDFFNSVYEFMTNSTVCAAFIIMYVAIRLYITRLREYHAKRDTGIMECTYVKVGHRSYVKL